MKYLMILSFSCFAGSIFGQDCTPWFPFKEGSTFEYTFYDKKDKMTSRMVYQVMDMQKAGAETTYDIQTTMFDKKDRESSAFHFAVSCQDGSYKVNVSNFMNPQMKEIFGDMEIKVSGDELVIPQKLSVGQKLPDASSISEAEMGIVNMKLEMDITDREVIRTATVETPVATYDAYVITSTQKVQMPMMKRSYQSIAYYTEGVGQVKSESLDKKGKVSSYMLLTKFVP